jgi:hypothetical protein
LTRPCAPSRFNLSHSTAEHRKSFDAFAIRLYPADVVAAGVPLGGAGAIELSVAGNAADPAVLYFHVAGTSPDPPGAAPSWRPS